MLTEQGCRQAENNSFKNRSIFDPARVIDQATYEKPFAYNDGIEYVVVNGQLVLDRDRHTGAKPGKALRIQ